MWCESRVACTCGHMIAALYVERGGAYWNLDGVDPWDEARDAMTYPGPWPVVAHPPCSRWCRLAGFVEARFGYRRGEDGGTFAAALQAVRTWGGVLEHPAYSDAWAAHGLNPPPRTGGWVNADFVGGWTCHVEQGRYGHLAQKGTWLYAVGVELPDLRWGYGLRTGVNVSRLQDARERGVAWANDTRSTLITPEAFRDELLSMARSVIGTGHAYGPSDRCAARGYTKALDGSRGGR